MSLSDFLPQRRPVWVLMTASAVCSLIVLDTNIVAVSLPAIARSLNAGFADLEWVVSAYMLAFAACLLPAGSIADRWGRRRTMLVGLVGFILASLACGAAETTTAMNIARAIKGVGSALLLTSALAVIGHTFHEERERMRAWSFWGGCMGLAMTIAPVFGGIVTAWLGWRWIFYLNLPIGLLLLTLVWRCIEESRDPQAARLDPLGSLCFSAGLFGVIWALIGGSEAGWTSTATLGRAGAGVLLLMLFIVVEMRQQRPMVDLALFRSPRFIGAVLAMFGYATSAQVMMTFLPLYMQNAF
ncbi:MAG: MFS transporter, partial [Microvirgula sp.]